MTDWLKTLHRNVPWQECYPIVAKAAREYLDGHAGRTFTTAQLGDALFPTKGNRTPPIKAARIRLFKALFASVNFDLRDYATAHIGQNQWRGGKECTRWQWSVPADLVEDL